MSDIRQHNVYSNDEVAFISQVVKNLFEQGFRLALINGSTTPVNISSSILSRNLGSVLSGFGHDVLVIYEGDEHDRRRSASLIFEKDIYKEGEDSSETSVTDVLNDVTLRVTPFLPFLLDIIKDSAKGFEKRPTISKLIAAGKTSTDESSPLVVRIRKIIKDHESDDALFGPVDLSDALSFLATRKGNPSISDAMSELEQKLIESDERISAGIKRICESHFELLTMNGDRLTNITKKDPSLWKTGNYVIVRSNGSVAGVVKIDRFNAANPDKNRVSLLNRVWSSSFPMQSVVDEMNGVANQSDSDGIIDVDRLIALYLEIADELVFFSQKKSSLDEQERKFLLTEYILAVFSIIKDSGRELSRNNIFNAYFYGNISEMIENHVLMRKGYKDDSRFKFIDGYNRKLYRSSIFQKDYIKVDGIEEKMAYKIHNEITEIFSTLINIDNLSHTSKLK